MLSPRRWTSGRVVLACLPLLLLAGCAFVTPRFPQEVQTSFARDDMRKLSTRSLELYYPAHLRPTALRIAARVEDCVGRLRKLTVGGEPRDRVLVYLTSANFNNAYVVPNVINIPQQMVLPQHMTLELFNFLNLGATEIGDVGCHESVHYVQMQQTDGIWGVLNDLTGGLVQPNIFTESWFLEGLATYYEGHLPQPTGRPYSPIWNGWYSSVVEHTGGDLDHNFGYLSPESVAMDPFGGNYLGGSHFIEWLARTQGEEKLWSLVEVQGESFLSPLGVTLRFKAVYGKTIGGLFDEYASEMARAQVKRQKPATQQTLASEVGYFSRLAVSPADGATAVVSSRREEPVRLTVRERDGRVRFSKRLTPILPGRRWVLTSPQVMSGLSFSADGRSLYVVSGDLDDIGNYTAKLWHVDTRTGRIGHLWDGLRGMGGSVTPDGRSYVFVQVDGDTANLVRLELATNRREALTSFQGLVSLGPPAVSPDGGRLAFPMRGPDGWDLALREADGTVRWLTRDGRFNYSPKWLDDERLLFLRETDGRLQAHVMRVATGEHERITDAPHLVMDAAPVGTEEVVFLNREGLNFSLDRAPIASVEARPPPPPPTEPPPTEETAAGPAAPPEPEAPVLALPPLVPEAPPDILSDKPYSALEGFFIPQLRVPFIYVLPGSNEGPLRVIGGLSISGQDRLGFHAYALNLGYDTDDPTPSIFLAYGNAQLAPWYVYVTGARDDQETRQDLRATLSLSRTFWTTPVTFGLFALRRDYKVTERRPFIRTSLVGPEASTSYFAGESTPYGGIVRGLGLSGSAGIFPKSFATSQTLGDVRVGVDLWAGGLPGTPYDNFQLSLVGRFLPGAPDGLLEVGGVGLGYSLYSSNESGGTIARPLQFQPGVAFTEYLRGYEDFTVGARNAVIATAKYRYRFIFDRGWASTLYLGPSFFIKSLDLEGFASWARTDWRSNHRAAGAAVYLRTTFGQAAPVILYYQFAERFDDGLGSLHLVGLIF
ncbi:hypothetical protein P2318_18760 [Myxococcaceae bacterium GXIMD 01537]